VAKGQVGGGDAAAEGIRHHEIGDAKKRTFIPKLLFSKEGDISLRTFCMNAPLPDRLFRGKNV
jgi:hypothetical protein